MTPRTFYTVTDRDQHFLCVIDDDGKFYRFPINPQQASRVALECAVIAHKAIAKGD